MPKKLITPDDIKEEGGILTIKFKPNPKGELSSTGKSIVVASSEGFIKAGNYSLSINVIKKEIRRRKNES